MSEKNENLEMILELAKTLKGMDGQTQNTMNKLLNKFVLDGGAKAEEKKPVAKIKQSTVKNSDEDYLKYKEELQSSIKETIENRKYTSMKEVLNYVKKYWTNKYGVVFKEIEEKFKKVFDRFPNNNYELLWWAEEEYPQIKGLTFAIIKDLGDTKIKEMDDPCHTLDDIKKYAELIRIKKFPNESRSARIFSYFYNKYNIDTESISNYYRNVLHRKRKTSILDMVDKNPEIVKEKVIKRFNAYLFDCYKDIMEGEKNEISSI